MDENLDHIMASMHTGGRSSVNAVGQHVLRRLGLPYTPLYPRADIVTQHNLWIEHAPVAFVGYVDLKWCPYLFRERELVESDAKISRFYVPSGHWVPFELVLSRQEVLESGLGRR